MSTKWVPNMEAYWYFLVTSNFTLDELLATHPSLSEGQFRIDDTGRLEYLSPETGQWTRIARPADEEMK